MSCSSVAAMASAASLMTVEGSDQVDLDDLQAVSASSLSAVASPQLLDLGGEGQVDGHCLSPAVRGGSGSDQHRNSLSDSAAHKSASMLSHTATA
jgi:hypothetical protein